MNHGLLPDMWHTVVLLQTGAFSALRGVTLVDEGTPGHPIPVKSADTTADPDDAHRGHEWFRQASERWRITCTCLMSCFSPESYSSPDNQSHLCRGLITPYHTEGGGEGQIRRKMWQVWTMSQKTSTFNMIKLSSFLHSNSLSFKE